MGKPVDLAGLELGETVSMSKYPGTARYRYQSIKVSTLVGWLFLDARINSSIEFSFPNIISGFSLCKLDLQCKYRVSSIEYRTQL